MSNITELPPSTSFKPDQALQSALNGNLQDVVIIGYDQDGDLFMRSSHMSRADAAYLLLEALDWARGK